MWQAPQKAPVPVSRLFLRRSGGNRDAGWGGVAFHGNENTIEFMSREYTHDRKAVFTTTGTKGVWAEEMLSTFLPRSRTHLWDHAPLHLPDQGLNFRALKYS